MMKTDNLTQDYNPAGWCFNGHIHTILCSLIFTSPVLHTDRVVIDTPDDDFLELDTVDKGQDKPVAVLFHGLEGHSRRYYVTRLAEQLILRDFSVILVNFRGCGSKMNRQRRFYHSGETKDIETVLQINIPTHTSFLQVFHWEPVPC